jgi:hypothetical protein
MENLNLVARRNSDSCLLSGERALLEFIGAFVFKLI